MCSNCECNASVPSESEQTHEDIIDGEGDIQNEEGFSLLCPDAQQWWTMKPAPPTGFRYLGLTETVVSGDRWVNRSGYDDSRCNSAIGGIVWEQMNDCGWGRYSTEGISAIIRPIVSEVKTEAKPHVSPLPAEGFLTMLESDIVDDKTRMQYVFDVERVHYDDDGKKIVGNVRLLLDEKYPNGYGMAENGTLYEIGYTGKQKAIAFDNLIRQVLKVDRWSTSGVRIIERLYAVTQWNVLTAEGDGLHDIFEQHRPGSCMSYDKCRHLREVYAQNPESVQVVYMRKADNPLAESDCSALYWIGKKRIYLDRIYSNGSIDNKRTIDVLADFLADKYGKPCVFIYGGDTAKRTAYTPDVTFKLTNPGTPLPYIDSLCFVKKYDSDYVWLTSKSHDVCAQNTQGTWPDGRQGTQCCDCGECDDPDDMTEDDGNWYCSSCWSDRQSSCQWSEESYPSDEVSEVRVYARCTAYQQRRGIGEVCWRYLEIAQEQLDSDFVEASDGRGYIHNDHYVETNRGDTVANDPDSDEFSITEDGEIYHPDDVVAVDDGRVMPMDECVEIDETWYVSGEEPEAEEPEAEETETETDTETEEKSEVTL